MEGAAALAARTRFREGWDGKLPRVGSPAAYCHLPSEHVLLSSPADAAGSRGALLTVLRHREHAFRARRRGSDLLRWRLGPGRLGRWRLGLASRALRPERHAAQPHEVGLQTQPPPSPHSGRRERADQGPRRRECWETKSERPEKSQGLTSPPSAPETPWGLGSLQ